MFTRHTTSLSYATLGLALCFFLVSVLALAHVYVNDELSNPRGCQIGQWVQHGQTVVAAVLLFSFVRPFSFFSHLHMPDLLVHRLAPLRLTARAPPLFSCP